MTGLFYRGRINSVYGASGDGKTWIAAVAPIVEAVARDQPAMMIDWEDSPDGLAARFVAATVNGTRLDVTQIDAVLYRNPATGLGSAWGQAAMRASVDLAPAVVVLDSVGEAMAHAGVDSNSDTEVAAWMAQVKQITRWPSTPAVILLDHIPKNTDNPSRGAIGSQRKLAAITGAAYRTQVITPFSVNRAGAIKLVVDKDRLGTRPRGSTAAIVDLVPTEGGGIAIDYRSDDTATTDGHWRPTVYMERVSLWLELYPGASMRDIEQGVQGKGSTIRAAVAALVAEGFVDVTPGARGAFHHTVRNPFRELDSLTASHRVPPRPDRVPDAVVDPKTTASRVPPLRGRGDAVEERGSGTPNPQPDRVPLDADPDDLFA